MRDKYADLRGDAVLAQMPPELRAATQQMLGNYASQASQRDMLPSSGRAGGLDPFLEAYQGGKPYASTEANMQAAMGFVDHKALGLSRSQQKSLMDLPQQTIEKAGDDPAQIRDMLHKAGIRNDKTIDKILATDNPQDTLAKLHAGEVIDGIRGPVTDGAWKKFVAPSGAGMSYSSTLERRETLAAALGSGAAVLPSEDGFIAGPNGPELRPVGTVGEERLREGLFERNPARMDASVATMAQQTMGLDLDPKAKMPPPTLGDGINPVYTAQAQAVLGSEQRGADLAAAVRPDVNIAAPQFNGVGTTAIAEMVAERQARAAQATMNGNRIDARADAAAKGPGAAPVVENTVGGADAKPQSIDGAFATLGANAQKPGIATAQEIAEHARVLSGTDMKGVKLTAQETAAIQAIVSAKPGSPEARQHQSAFISTAISADGVHYRSVGGEPGAQINWPGTHWYEGLKFVSPDPKNVMMDVTVDGKKQSVNMQELAKKIQPLLPEQDRQTGMPKTLRDIAQGKTYDSKAPATAPEETPMAKGGEGYRSMKTSMAGSGNDVKTAAIEPVTEPTPDMHASQVAVRHTMRAPSMTV